LKERERERESQFNRAGGSELQISAAVIALTAEQRNTIQAIRKHRENLKRTKTQKQET